MARLPYHPSYLSKLMFPRSPKYWHCLHMEYCHCTNRISKWSKGICKMIILWPPSWPTFPSFPTFSTTFHTFIMRSSCGFFLGDFLISWPFHSTVSIRCPKSSVLEFTEMISSQRAQRRPIATVGCVETVECEKLQTLGN